MKIGFFDSGLGGLFVLKATAQFLSEYEYEFYGDTLNVPYGGKTEDEIYELSKIAVTHLFERGCVLVVIACNTASAQTLRKLQDTFLPEMYPDRKILGVIIPMVEEVIEHKVEKVLLLATKRTVDSNKYNLEFGTFQNRPRVISCATPQLVPLIESGLRDEAVVEAIVVIDPYVQNEHIDALILGCTHYGLLKEGIQAKYPNLQIFSQAEIIPKKLKSYLDDHAEIETKLSRNKTRNIFLSKHNSMYDTHVGDILGGHFLAD